MRQFMIAIKDRALNGYGRPFAVPSLGVAIRAFGDMVSGGDAEMARHADDYDIYHIGFFDDEMGTIIPLEAPVQVGIGKQLVVKKGDA